MCPGVQDESRKNVIMFEIYTEMYRKSIKKLLLTYLECSPVLFIKPNITQIIKSYCQEIAELLTQGHIIKSWKKKIFTVTLKVMKLLKFQPNFVRLQLPLEVWNFLFNKYDPFIHFFQYSLLVLNICYHPFGACLTGMWDWWIVLLLSGPSRRSGAV